MKALTIFTAPKPFTNSHIAMIQRNAIRSWLALGDAVEVFLVGDEEGIAEAAAELGTRFIGQVKRNDSGTPLLSSIFGEVRERRQSSLLAYVNADILLLPGFLPSALSIAEQCRRFLVVGQRWDLDVQAPLDFSPGWDRQLQTWIRESGKLHKPAGSDYFIYPDSCFETLPDFAVGRAGWDNWMIYEARRQGWPVINATGEIEIIHQQHDYSHLPGGVRHYRVPESAVNLRLAGGARTIFRLPDADYRVVDGKVRRAATDWQKFWREVEIFPLIRLRSYRLGQLFFALFHPLKAYAELRSWLRKKTADNRFNEDQ